MDFKIIGAGNLRLYMDRRRYMIVDLRSRQEYGRGHFFPAKNIPYESFKMEDIEAGKICVFYCDRGVHSIDLARKLSDRGIYSVAVATPYSEWRGRIRGEL